MTTQSDETVPAPLRQVRAVVAEAAREAGRDPADVRLIAVSKTVPPDRITPLLRAGHRLFGENRVQEAAEKWPALREQWPETELHLIGPLQSNKVKEAVALADAIHTVDRDKIARRLAAEIKAQGRAPALFIQVNTGEEPQKAGIPPTETEAFLARCRDEHGLAITGLMCIPPQDEPPAPHFALLADMAARLGLPGLSMGMSGDFETAIRFGATHVRVGSALFGARPPA